MRVYVLIFLVAAAVAAAPDSSQRIGGGSTATIAQYPHVAALLYSSNLSTWAQACTGVIISIKSVLTAAHCPFGDAVERWRFRVGAATSATGGSLHTIQTYLFHAQFNQGVYFNHDIAIFRSTTNITFSDIIQPARIAGSNYRVPDNVLVWAAGWGRTSQNGPISTSLRQVQIWSVNQDVCIARYREIGWTINENMLCAGWLDVGGRGQCQGDDGGPLYHDDVVVGVYSFGFRCGSPRFSAVNTRVSRYQSWIDSNADFDVQFVH